MPLQTTTINATIYAFHTAKNLLPSTSRVCLSPNDREPIHALLAEQPNNRADSNTDPGPTSNRHRPKHETTMAASAWHSKGCPGAFLFHCDNHDDLYHIDHSDHSDHSDRSD